MPANGRWYLIRRLKVNLVTRWMWVVSFTPRSVHSRAKNLSYPLSGRMDGRFSQCGRFGEEKSLLPLPGIEPCTGSHLATIPTDLSRLFIEILVIMILNSVLYKFSRWISLGYYSEVIIRDAVTEKCFCFWPNLLLLLHRDMEDDFLCFVDRAS